jgi:hypothetical protein
MKHIKLFALLAIFASFAACQKDDETVNNPSPVVNSPSDVAIMKGTQATLEFAFTAPAGFNSAQVTASNGSAEIVTNGTQGSTSGTIVVSFTAGNNTGAASAVLSITDKENQVSAATAVINVTEEQTIISVNSNISANTTWTSGKVYILESRIAVLSGVTLTIEPGVIVKGQAGTGANATALLVARGAKLMAEGTASSPIIFTSVADEIMPGEIESPNLDNTLNGLWGGLIVLGNAPISADNPSIQIEGIPASDPNGLFGGSDASDNSGVIMYVSIRHGGANIGEGNEINGLTLGGVGSGTVIENIEVVANQDDGIEWFGGTVNVKNVIVWNAGDDALDTDMSWAGTVDNFVIVNAGDECMELDGPEGTMEAGHTIKNGIVSAQDADGLVDLDDNSIVTITSVYFRDVKAGQDFDLNPSQLTASGLQATLPAGSAIADFFKGGSDSYVTLVNDGANTVGADVTKLTGWSWAGVSGVLDNLK